MTKNKKTKTIVCVETAGLINLRDDLIAFESQLKAIRSESIKTETVAFGALLHIERSLDRHAINLSDWLKEFEQGELPF